ncbi:MAG: exonuclease domain-containing protein [Lachnospiraceae bacterium]|nr:exonuclease domain-containing protein [Lachnospiraceae bacterium]
MKYVVIDLEMNSVKKKSEVIKELKMETIEIGAVMLDEELKEISSFITYVKPEYNDRISPMITNLTGITYEMVVNSPVFNDALRMFTEWCLKAGDDVTVYAWSSSDYSQIYKEIKYKKYQVTEEEKKILSVRWSDFQKEFDSHLGFSRQLSLKMALEMAGIDFAGKEHDALDDARNTAELLQVFRDKELFNKTLKKIQEAMKPSSSGYALGDMIDFSKLKLGDKKE